MFAILLLDMGHQLIKAYLAASGFFLCVCVSFLGPFCVSSDTIWGHKRKSLLPFLFSNSEQKFGVLIYEQWGHYFFLVVLVNQSPSF